MPPSDAKLNVGIHIALFGLTVGMAVVAKWFATDLVWSLWISSLTVGYSLILTSILGTLVYGSAVTLLGRTPGGGSASAPTQVPSGVAALPLGIFIAVVCFFTLGVTSLSVLVLVVLAASSVLAIGGMLRNQHGWPFPDPEHGLIRVLIALPGALFILGFFTVHFGIFHLVHGLFLNGFFPLVGKAAAGNGPDEMFGVVGACAREAFVRFWPFVAASALSRVPTYVAAFRTTDGSMMITPYVNVIRMHVMILVFAFLSSAGLQSYALYPLLIVYFLPIGDLVSVLRAKRNAGTPGPPTGPI